MYNYNGESITVTSGVFKECYIFDDHVFKFLKKDQPLEVYEEHYIFNKFCIENNWRVAECFGIEKRFEITGLVFEKIPPLTSGEGGIVPYFIDDYVNEFYEWLSATLDNLDSKMQEMFKLAHKESCSILKNGMRIIHYDNVGMKDSKLYSIDGAICQEEIDYIEDEDVV